MRPMFIAAGFLFAATTIALPAAAQSGGVMLQTAPGEAMAARGIKLEATITAIDPQTRLVGLMTKDGQRRNIVAGPEVRNFAQLHIGDKVTLEYVEALALELRKESTEEISRHDETETISAQPGATPGGLKGRTVTIMAEVVGLDAEAQTVSLKGPHRTVDLQIRNPEQFKLIAKGDRVKATYVEAVAVSVDPAGESE